MKITTQRQLLWIVNFALVLSLLGFVFLMQKNGGRARTRGIKKYHRALEKAVKSVKPPKTQGGTVKPGQNKLKTFLDKKFAFEGYIPPKVVKPGPSTTTKPKAPPLDSLIEVHMLLAPRELGDAGSGPQDVVNGGAFIKIKSVKADQFSTYWYRIGETIGAGHSARADKDATLEKWGPCVLQEVTTQGIVCSWNKEKDEAVVKIELHPDPDKVWIEGTVNGKEVKYGGPGSINNLKPGKGVVTPVGVGVALFKPGKSKGGVQIVELTDEGLKLFNKDGEGEKLLEKIGTKETKGGLTVTAIPRQLREFGLREGDVVIRVDNVPVKNKSTVTNYVRKSYKTRSSYGVTVLRDGRQRTISVRVPKNKKNINTRGVTFGQ